VCVVERKKGGLTHCPTSQKKGNKRIRKTETLQTGFEARFPFEDGRKTGGDRFREMVSGDVWLKRESGVRGNFHLGDTLPHFRHMEKGGLFHQRRELRMTTGWLRTRKGKETTVCG